jgi:hypothetical protein
MSTMRCSLLLLGCAFGFAPPAHQTTLTALRALKIAQRRLRPEVRAKLLSISSARSDGNLVPPAWRFLFLDAATSGNCRVVTVAAKTSSEHPDTVEAFGPARSEDPTGVHVIPQGKLFVDSDKVVENIRGTMKLKGVRAAEFRLLQVKGQSEPLWTVKLYGDNGSTPLGQFRVGAKSGTVEKGEA